MFKFLREQKSNSISKKKLKELLKNGESDEFFCRVKWCGENIDLSVDVNDSKEARLLIPVIEELFNHSDKWDSKVRNFAADEFHDLKNDIWLEENEEKVTRADFKERLHLQTISIDLDQNISFVFGDDDLFWGHYIDVLGTINGGLKHTTLFG